MQITVQEELAARIAALEFMVRQLYSTHLRAAGPDPLENALLTQTRAMTDLQGKLSQIPEDDAKPRFRRTVEHINRIFDELVQGFEAERGKSE